MAMLLFVPSLEMARLLVDQFVSGAGFQPAISFAFQYNPANQRTTDVLADAGGVAGHHVDWFGAGDLVAAMGQIGGPEPPGVGFARHSGADAVVAGAHGHGFSRLGHDFRSGTGGMKPCRSVKSNC